MATSSPSPWTYEEYLLLPDDGNRYEIIDGELLVTPAPKTRHQQLVKDLIYELEQLVRSGFGGRAEKGDSPKWSGKGKGEKGDSPKWSAKGRREFGPPTSRSRRKIVSLPSAPGRTD